MNQLVHANPEAASPTGVGQSARLVPGGMVQRNGVWWLRFTLLHEPAGSGNFRLQQWPEHAHDQGTRDVKVRASRVERGTAVTGNITGGLLLKLERVSALGDRTRKQRWWNLVVGGRSGTAVWDEMEAVLRDAGSVQPTIDHWINGCADLEREWRNNRCVDAERRLRGQPPLSRQPFDDTLRDRAAVGQGWDANPVQAIEISMTQARALGKQALSLRRQGEAARSGPGGSTMARGILENARRAAPSRDLPRPDPAYLFRAAAYQAPPALTETERVALIRDSRARTRWGQLMNHPSLLRLFGIATDYEVKLSDLGVATGSESFWLFAPHWDEQPMLACNVLTLGKLVAPRFRPNGDLSDDSRHSFWPCLTDEVAGSENATNLSMKDGFANLKQELAPKVPRYRLSTADGVSELVKDKPQATATEQSPGLVLLDHAAADDAIAEEAFRLSAAGASDPVVHDARMLRIGWQLDVRVGEKTEWHTMMARSIRYGLASTDTALEVAIAASYGDASHGDRRERRQLAEAAMIDTPPSVKEDRGGPLLLHEQIVAHWRGRPMGVTLVEDGTPREVRVTEDELAIGTAENLDRTVPPLRVGKEYSVRLRAVFVGGVVTALDAPMPAGDFAALGPVTFRREEAIKAPVVLHLEADLRRNATPVAAAASSHENLFRLPGRAPLQHAPDLILRPALRESGEPESTRRLILPPLVSLALADRLIALPAARRVGLRAMDFSSGGHPANPLEPGRGGWPGVRMVGDSTIALEKFAQVPQEAEANRELVFRAATIGAARPIDFLPDPHALLYRLALVWPEGGRLADEVALPVYDGVSYPDVRPLVLEVLPSAPSDTRTPRLEVVNSGIMLPFSPFGNNDRRAHLVRLRLATGEDVNVQAWCTSTDDRRADFQIWNEVDAELRAGLFSKPDETVAGALPLRAAHAVAVPEESLAPVLQPGLSPVWKDDALVLRGKVRAELHRLSGLRIDVSAASLVDGRFDDPEQRGRSREDRAAGRWPLELGTASRGTSSRERDPRDVLGFDVDLDGRVTLLQETATVVSFDGPPSKAQAAAAAGEGLDLEALSTVWPGAVKDGRARRLIVTPVALPGAASLLTDRHGDPVPARPLRGSIVPPAGSPPSSEIWLNARKRPTSPLRPWVVPTFQWEDGFEAENGQSWVTLTRSAVPRIRLSRPWFSSGEGEMLGIILWPPHLPSLLPGEVNFDRIKRQVVGALNQAIEPPPEMDLSALQDLDLGTASRFVTRWGDDPIRQPAGGFMPLLLSRANFEDALNTGDWRYELDAQVPLAREADTPSPPNDQTQLTAEWLRCCLLLTPPRFDPDLEEWYADLPVTLRGSVEPFLRLGLVRFQPHAAPELRCSTPAVAWTQLLPTRKLRWRRDGTTIKVEVSGPASRMTAIPPGLGLPPNSDLNTPTMRFNLLQRDALADGGFSESILEARIASEDSVTWSSGDIHVIWRATFLAPILPAGSTYHVIAEEVEERLAATPPPEAPGQTGRSHISDSGPRFAARVRV